MKDFFVSVGMWIGFTLFFFKDILGMLKSLWRWNDPSLAHWRRFMAKILILVVVDAVFIRVVEMCFTIDVNENLLKFVGPWIFLVSALILQYAHYRSMRLSPPANQSNTNEQHTDQLPNISLIHLLASQAIPVISSTWTMGFWLGYSFPQMFRWSSLAVWLGMTVRSPFWISERISEGAFFPENTKTMLVSTLMMFLGTLGVLGLVNTLAKRHCLWPLTLVSVLVFILLLVGSWFNW